MEKNSLGVFLNRLDSAGLLKRIRAEVDPVYEITEIVSRLYRHSSRDASGAVPTLLFESVRGARFPLVVNLLGREENVRLLLGDEPESVPQAMSEFLLELPAAFSDGGLLAKLWEKRSLLSRFRAAGRSRLSSAPVKEVIRKGEAVNLGELPILKCWPLDGGKFITGGLVITRSPRNGVRNAGIYRLQLLGSKELILHAQIQKGGGFHYAEAASVGRPLEVAIVVGTDPLLWLAGALPLPEGMDEFSFAGWLRGEPVPMVRCETLDLEVPASAEFVIEAVAYPGHWALEGPFGDHFGHYSHPSDFPVLDVRCVTHRREAIFAASIVGQPPQEDRMIGETVSRILTPLIRLMRPELEDLWPYYQAGFHNLLVASVRQRYEKEGIKTALGLLGEGQLSLAKSLFLVDPDVDVRDFRSVLRAVRTHFDPERDFILLPKTSQDTLDFTGARLNEGSKMIIDATSSRDFREIGPLLPIDPAFVEKENSDILNCRILEETLLVVRVREKGRFILETLLQRKDLGSLKMIAVVSEDVSLEDEALLLWGIFTRFDCAQDILFKGMRLQGSGVVYEGPMGIDATWKPHYPATVKMTPDIIRKVDERWSEYGL